MSVPVARQLLHRVSRRQTEMVELLEALVKAESPSSVPESQSAVQSILRNALTDLGCKVRKIPGIRTGGHLLAMPLERQAGMPAQVLLGHCDTVWPLGAVNEMPVEIRDGKLYGPGAYDMKAGLVQGIFALWAVRTLDKPLQVAPLMFINSDEEIGSPESSRHIRRLARMADRALVLEPSLGPSGKLKTTRKGVGRFTIRIVGRAAHAGLDPEKGASAILELTYVVQQLFALNDPEGGVSVNVGTIDGGLRPNVVASSSRAEVDVRVPTHVEAQRIEEAIRALHPVTPGTRLDIDGGFGRPPMEATPGNRHLWRLAQAAADDLGIALEESAAGGGSDGNTTSQFTPTLDGLGAVGDGAHALDECVALDCLAERTALLATLLLAPPLGSRGGTVADGQSHSFHTTNPE